MIKVYGNVPSNRWGACSVGIGSRIYYMGGINLQGFCDFHVYYLDTDPKIARRKVKRYKK